MEKLNENIGYFSILIFFGIYFFIKYCNFEIFPDSLEIESNENISNFLTTIIGSIASFSGLLVAVIIASYEFYRTKSGANLLYYFRTNSYIQLLIIYNVSALLISGFTLLEMEKNHPNDSIELSLCYYSISLFFFLLPVTIVLFWKISKTLNVNYISEKLLAKLSFENDPYVQRSWMGRGNFLETPAIEKIKDSPVYNLSKLISYSYSRNDEETANGIINQFSSKVIEFYYSKKLNPLNTKYWGFQTFLGVFYLKILIEVESNSTLRINVLHNVLANLNKLYSELNKRKLDLMLLRELQGNFFPYLFNSILKSDFEKKIGLVYLKNIIDNILLNSNLKEKHIEQLSRQYYEEFRERGYKFLPENNDLRMIQTFNYEELLDLADYFQLMLDHTIKTKNEPFFLEVIQLIGDFSVNNRAINNYLPETGNDKDILYGYFFWKSLRITSNGYSMALKRGLTDSFNPDLLIKYDSLSLFFGKGKFYANDLLNVLMNIYKEANGYGLLNYKNLCGIRLYGGIKYNKQVNFTSIGTLIIHDFHESEMHQKAMNLLLFTLEGIELEIKDSDDEDLKKAPKDICIEIRERYNNLVKYSNRPASQKLRKRLLKIINE